MRPAHTVAQATNIQHEDKAEHAVRRAQASKVLDMKNFCLGSRKTSQSPHLDLTTDPNNGDEIQY